MTEFKDMFINGTPKSPQIDFNHLTGELKLFGKSFPENATEVYEPLLFWINEYIKSPHQTTNLYLRLEYFNSSSFRCIVQMIRALSTIDQKDYFLCIHLYFNDEEFENKDADELRDVFSSLFDESDKLKIKISIKSHGLDKYGNHVKESTIHV